MYLAVQSLTARFERFHKDSIETIRTEQKNTITRPYP